MRTNINDELNAISTARWTLRIGIFSVLIFIIWASIAKIDQITRTTAQIIASARTQVIQTPDGGVLTELYVKEGDSVKAGQRLGILEKARAQAAVDDSHGKVAALKITLARLYAEVYGTPLSFSPELMSYKEFISNQTALYKKRTTAIEEDVAALKKNLVLAKDELGMNMALEKSGDVSRSDILRLHRQVAEIEAQITNKQNKYFQDTQTEMTKAQEELNTQIEQLRERQQILEHTELIAPTDGIIKNMPVTTLGGVLRQGDVVFEILPTGSALIAEAKISPADIAFIEVGQSASVKLDAYDSAIFGAIDGKVIYISPDTIFEETRQGKQAFYRVQVQLGAHQFKGEKAEKIQVRPGMTASLEIKALERTVLSYLTKPITKTFTRSMGER